ncbi:MULTISPECIES: phosphotransferase [unclassified Rathayibacter]|uniref:phosphotransferase n=1 Tax=unclassified Rathayibacter TaxID=2609250 RepID=UPI000CE73D96|nr:MULTISPECIES: phosphotransferase [unclassified Rathayibacter]PPI41097.1 hypothetical protein C5D50_03045 [Rathayibacter sp. RFBD1]PPI61999.1 hypothetical protein C5D38_02605 [Rathayibacter sp. TRS19]QHC72420.1 phosphotransferase [Rathayibacter sp. VKM Ac-2805]
MSAGTVWSVRTRVWRQSIEALDEGYLLRREYAAAPAGRPPAEAVRTAHAAVVPAALDASGTWAARIGAAGPVAADLLPGSPASGREAFAATAERLGAVLAALHAGERGAGPVPLPLRRLEQDLRDAASSPVGRAITTALGPDRSARLASLLDAVPSEGVRVHGAFGLGSVFVDPCGDVVVVAGPESGFGPPELDAGWLRGELTELSLAAAAAGESDAPFARAAESFDRGYAEAGGGPLDPSLLDAVVALRFALHQWDFHETHGSLPASTDLAFLAWLLDRRPVDHSIPQTTTHRR